MGLLYCNIDSIANFVVPGWQSRKFPLGIRISALSEIIDVWASR